jgi:sugar/nucleoside kinase (ribokinase family)
MNDAETLAVELNVFDAFDPRIPAEYADSEYVFLANGSPRVQRAVREQMRDARMVVCDTMNLWIATARDELMKLFAEVDGVVLNDGEARMFTRCDRLVECGKRILETGPRFVVIKKGEHGALCVARDEVWSLPAYPTAEVKDPTGAGDSFAGGLMGCLAATRDDSPAGLKRAMACGTVVASLAVEGFGTSGLETAAREDLDGRLARYRAMLQV